MSKRGYLAVKIYKLMSKFIRITEYLMISPSNPSPNFSPYI